MSPIWSNWPGEQVCAPSAIVRPTSEAELADVIAQAAKKLALVQLCRARKERKVEVWSIAMIKKKK
ncbi:hypothetical protein R6867_10720, partial [Mycobacterium tuberculosis]